MEKSLEQKLKDFKHILECFVAYLNWASNRKKNIDATKFAGYHGLRKTVRRGLF